MKPIKSISVSVIIPVYNAEDYLDECLQSIIYQTLEEIEMICVDDGSNDNSLSILKNYAVKDSRIIVLNQTNQGAGAARNNGLKRAKGEFVAFMDADDYYPNKKVLHKLYTKAVDNNALICGGSMSYMDVVNEYFNTKYTDDLSKNTFDREGKIKYADYQFDYSYTRFIYKRELLIKNNLVFPNYKCFEDPPFFVRAMLSAGEFYAVPDVTYVYRVRHKEKAWHCEKVSDLLTGLSCNLVTSKEHGLTDLHRLTFSRLIKEFLPAVCQYNNSTIVKQLVEIKGLLNQEVVDKSDYKRFTEYLNSMRFAPLFSINYGDKHKMIQILGVKISLRNDLSFIQRIFSIRNENKFKVLRILGIKIKFKRKKKRI